MTDATERAGLTERRMIAIAKHLCRRATGSAETVDPDGNPVWKHYMDEAFDIMNAGVETALLDRAAEVLRMYRERLQRNGVWDDGCFYYGNTSASELQEPLELGETLEEELRDLQGRNG